MKSIAVPPFRRPTDGVVSAGPWELFDGASVTRLPKSLLKWDYNQAIRIRRDLRIDLSQARIEAGIDDSVALWVAVIVHCSGTRAKRCVYSGELADRPIVEIDLDVVIPGAALCGVLEIQLQLLSEGVRSPSLDPFAPRYPGSVLWQDATQLELEGIASRFPIVELDFAEDLSLPADAAWFLDVDDSDPDSSFTQCVCLYINRSKPALVAALTGAGAQDQVQGIVEFIRYDLGRALILAGLNSPDLLRRGASAPKDSLAATLARLVSLTFPRKSIESIAAMLHQRPTRFESELQAQLRLFAEHD